MNKRYFILPLVCMMLVSCADVANVYPAGAYLSGSFVDHVYNTWEGETKEASARHVYTKTLANERNGYFCGSGNYTSPSTCYGYGQAKSWHDDYFRKDDGSYLLWGYRDAASDIVPGAIGSYVDNSSLFNVIYSQNKRLDRYLENFSRGYLSKLYNGQIKCDGWSYYAMAVLSNEGYGTMFPYELKNAEYFATSLLVSTDYTEPGTSRVVTSNIHFTFYKWGEEHLEGYAVTLEDVKLSCNAGAALTSLVGFTFADAGIDPNKIVGMSVTWDLIEDESGATNDFSVEGRHDGLSIYEVLIPDSTWY